MSTSEGVLQGQIAHKCTDIITEYKFIQLDTSECDSAKTVVETAGTGGQIYGITATSTAAANRHVTFNTSGECFLYVNGNSANISVGHFLKSDSLGFGVVADSDHDKTGAAALEATTSDAVIIKVRCVPLGLFETG